MAARHKRLIDKHLAKTKSSYTNKVMRFSYDPISHVLEKSDVTSPTTKESEKILQKGKIHPTTFELQNLAKSSLAERARTAKKVQEPPSLTYDTYRIAGGLNLPRDTDAKIYPESTKSLRKRVQFHKSQTEIKMDDFSDGIEVTPENQSQSNPGGIPFMIRSPVQKSPQPILKVKKDPNSKLFTLPFIL